MKLIVTWKANGQAFSEIIEGTREECYEGVRKLMQKYSAATSFISREVPEVNVAAASDPHLRGWPVCHRDGLD